MSHVLYIHNATMWPNGTTAVLAETKSHGQEPNVLGDILQKYYSVFLICFGTIGNGLSLAVLSRKTFRTSPIGIYLRWLAISDLSALYTGTVYFWAKANFNYDIRDTNALSCRFHRWFSYAAVDLSAWILILMTVARLISIMYPLRTFCTRMVAYISLFVTLTAALLVNLPMFLFYGKMTINSRGYTYCKYFPEYRFFIKEVWNWLVLVKFGLLPVTILIVLNTILCIRVFRSSKEMKRMNNNSYKIHRSPPDRSSSSGRCGYVLHRLSGRRLLKQHAGNSPRKLNISNTDITRLTTVTGDMATSLLQSSEDINRRSALNSRYASTEELRKELNETYGIAQANAVPKPQNETFNSSDQEDKGRGNAIVRFAKYVFNTKIRNRKSKYLLSSWRRNNDSNDGNVLKETRPLSTSSDNAVVLRSKNGSRSLYYDSRNSFHFVRDSLQYTKEKRGLATSSHESEEMVPCKRGDSPNYAEENKYLLKQQTLADNKDIKRPTPIFTISAAGDEGPSKNVPLSEGDSCAELSDVRCAVRPDPSSATANQQECPDDSYFLEESESDSDSEDKLDSDSHSNSRNNKDFEKRKAFGKNKDPPSLNNSFEIHTPDVTDNLRAASKKLQHLSLHPDSDFSSTIPLQKLNKRQSSENHDNSEGEDAGSDSSRRSTGNLATQTRLKPTPGDGGSPCRMSPCMVSNGLLTPRGDPQTCGSRQSLNVAIVRGRTGNGKAKTRNLTATLLVVNIVFIICNIPIVIFMTSRKYLFKDRSPNSPGKTFELIANFIMYTNNAANFIMYCLSGTRFRVELKAMLREVLDLICGRRKKRRRVNARRW